MKIKRKASSGIHAPTPHRISVVTLIFDFVRWRNHSCCHRCRCVLQKASGCCAARRGKLAPPSLWTTYGRRSGHDCWKRARGRRRGVVARARLVERPRERRAPHGAACVASKAPLLQHNIRVGGDRKHVPRARKREDTEADVATACVEPNSELFLACEDVPLCCAPSHAVSVACPRRGPNAWIAGERGIWRSGIRSPRPVPVPVSDDISSRLAFMSQTQPSCRLHMANVSPAVVAESQPSCKQSKRFKANLARSNASRPVPITHSWLLMCQPAGRTALCALTPQSRSRG